MSSSASIRWPRQPTRNGVLNLELLRGTPLKGDPPPAYILCLPPELVDIIVEHLEAFYPGGAAPLSTTCKALYINIGVKKYTDPARYVQFQMQLQMEYGGLLRYCLGCRAVRPPEGHPEYCGYNHYHFSPRQSDISSRFFFAHAYHVMEYERMECHPGWCGGIKPDDFARNNWGDWRDSKPTWQRTSTAKICDGEIYLRIEHVYEGDRKEFEHHLGTKEYWLCRHQKAMHLEMARRAMACNHMRCPVQPPFKEYVSCCATCPSEFFMNVLEVGYTEDAEPKQEPQKIPDHTTNPSKDWRVTIAAYHNLGSRGEGSMVSGYRLFTEDVDYRGIGYGPVMPVKRAWDDECRREAIAGLRTVLKEKREKLQKGGQL